jgi:peroxiredoxin
MGLFISINLVLLWTIVIVLLLVQTAIIRRFRRVYEETSYSTETLVVGEFAPDFIALDQLGREVTLAQYIGRPTVFIFISPYCEGCLAVMPQLKKIYLRTRGSKLNMVLVTTSTPLEMQNLLQEYQVEIPLLQSSLHESALSKLYNPSDASPFFCYINEEGLVMATDFVGAGEWSQLRREWEMMHEQTSLTTV